VAVAAAVAAAGFAAGAFWASTAGAEELTPGCVIVVCETWMTGAATGRGNTAWLVATACGAVFVCEGETMWAARAASAEGPVALCVATIPNAARPNVSNAAMTTITTRIAPSATILTGLRYCVK
jgi:hypothetical protein